MLVIEMLKALVFGVVEGITEWLPISSTGHMILLQEIMPLNVSEKFWNMFLVVIQLGAILAVLLFFWNKLWPFGFKKRPFIRKDVFSMWFKVVVSCVPAAVVGLLWKDELDRLFYNFWTVAIFLILFGILFIIVENRRIRPKIHSVSGITYQMAVVIGLFQVVAAVFPGTSRSGATIIGALLLSISRATAAEFTFFLSIPVMFGASLLELLKFEGTLTGQEIAVLLTGMVSAFAVSIFSIRYLMNYVKKHNFKAFGWYRIILGIVVLGYFLFNMV